jgi:hypothetical protein
MNVIEKFTPPFIWGILLVAACCLVPPAKSQGSDQTQEPFQLILGLDLPVIEFSDYPAPIIPDGELWEISDFPQVATYSFIPRGVWSDLSVEHQAIMQEAKTLQKAGNGVAARDMLLPLADEIPEGAAARYIAFLHEGTTADIPKDTEIVFTWMLRAAQLNPNLYRWVGNNAPKGTNDDLHYWSKGLSRGCTQCLRSLLTPASLERIGRDRALRYAVFANEIGDMYAPKLLFDLIRNIEVNPEGLLPETVVLAAELRADAEAAGGGIMRLGLPVAVQKHTRSGLIHERLRQTAIGVESGNGNDQSGEDALRGIIFGLEGGRYLPVLVDAFMDRYPDYNMNVAAKASLVLRSVHEGEPRHAAAAATISKMRLNRFNHDSGGWRQMPGGTNWMGQDDYLSFGMHHQTIPLATELYIRSERPDETREVLYNRASQCIYDAITQNRNSQFAQGSALMSCRAAVRDVWSTSSTSIDVGLLNEQVFRSLIAATETTQQQLQQDRAEYEAKVADAKIRQFADQIIEYERDSRRRLGLAPRYFENFMEIEEEAERILDAAYLRAELDNPSSAPPIRVGATSLRSFYDEYLTRKAAVDVGQGGYAGPRESVAVCENVWSFGWLPACQR